MATFKDNAALKRIYLSVRRRSVKGRERRLAPHGQEGLLNWSRAVHMYTSVTEQRVRAAKQRMQAREHKVQAANRQAVKGQGPKKEGLRPKKKAQERDKDKDKARENRGPPPLKREGGKGLVKLEKRGAGWAQLTGKDRSLARAPKETLKVLGPHTAADTVPIRGEEGSRNKGMAFVLPVVKN